MNRITSYVLITVLVLSSTLLNWQTIAASTIEDAKNKVNEIEEKQDSLNEKQDEIKNEKAETTGKIDKNLTHQEKVTKEINAIDAKLAETQSSIQEKEGQITKTNNEIDQLKVEIKELQKSIKKRDKLLKERLRTIQQNGGDMRYIEVILGSQNFGDFVSRSSAVNTIMDQDKNIMETQMAAKKELEMKKEEVVKKKEALEGQKQELVSLKAQLDDQMAKKEALMAELEKEHASLEENKKDLEAQEAKLHEQEQKLQRAMEAAKDEIQRIQEIAREKARKAREAAEQAAKEKAAQEAANQSSGNQNLQTVAQTNPGGFIWPAAGNRVTSVYGMRRHPVTGAISSHAGIDIANSIGTPIRASISGYAMPVNIHWSYGNHVMVVGEVNGKEYTTLYAHMSSTAIGGGRYVEQGDIIGYMGSTGRSTGSHLHFEVHVGQYNGFSSSINPASVLN